MSGDINPLTESTHLSIKKPSEPGMEGSEGFQDNCYLLPTIGNIVKTP